MKLGLKIVISLILVFFGFAYEIEAQEVMSPVYGAPYFIDTQYPYGSRRSDTLTKAIESWWIDYKAYWHVSSCSYSLQMKTNGQMTGLFATVQLTNGCSGGGGFYGTPACQEGYDLINGQCVSKLKWKNN